MALLTSALPRFAKAANGAGDSMIAGRVGLRYAEALAKLKPYAERNRAIMGDSGGGRFGDKTSNPPQAAVEPDFLRWMRALMEADSF